MYITCKLNSHRVKLIHVCNSNKVRALLCLPHLPVYPYYYYSPIKTIVITGMVVLVFFDVLHCIYLLQEQNERDLQEVLKKHQMVSNQMKGGRSGK